MANNPIGPLLAADEQFTHQITDTFAVVGTTLSRSFLDRMSDKQFYHWTRRVILALGAVYIAQGLWLMVTR